MLESMASDCVDLTREEFASLLLVGNTRYRPTNRSILTAHKNVRNLEDVLTDHETTLPDRVLSPAGIEIAAAVSPSARASHFERDD